MTISLTGGGIVLKRLETLLANAAPNSPTMKAALGKAGALIVARAVLNVRNQSIIDQGHLINSLNYRFVSESQGQTGIQVGSFGVVYAAMNEFGGPVTPAMRRAMFAAMRRRGKMQPGAAAKAKANSKGVIQGNFWRARPFLTPAFDRSVDEVADLIINALASEGS